uniref:ATP synthase F1 subunit 4 n=1 Tax=Herposiphonia versicolor TaxID=2007163 RepID=UPI0022FD8A30|nr:ATP synthase F1 subunit 4 [Herposiphonia versicolor]WAX04184.1 ATP synthase F1 subunit 4 [Herposiphonia versicolor]
MKFFFSFIILFVIIITNKLFLFNEEFLILISFFGFCFIISENLRLMINSRFSDKVFSIKNSLLISIDGLKIQLVQKKKLNIKLTNLASDLFVLKKYYLKFSVQFLMLLITYLKSTKEVKLIEKLKEIKFIEDSYSKFIVTLISKKINEIVLIKFFFEKNLEIKHFKTLKSINNLNLINKI